MEDHISRKCGFLKNILHKDHLSKKIWIFKRYFFQENLSLKLGIFKECFPTTNVVFARTTSATHLDFKGHFCRTLILFNFLNNFFYSSSVSKLGFLEHLFQVTNVDSKGHFSRTISVKNVYF